MTVMVVGTLCALFAAGVPQALREFEAARARLATGRVALTVVGGPPTIGMPVHRYGMEIARNGDILFTYYGDHEGVFSRDACGYPMVGGGAKTLIQQDWVWHRADSDFTGYVIPREQFHFGHNQWWWSNVDLRTVGMVPTWEAQQGKHPDSVLRDLLDGCADVDEEREGSTHRVTLRYDDGREIVYELDETKGWNATRISGSDTQGAWSCDVQLQETNGTWFPSHVVLQREDRVLTEWFVEDAAFNGKDPPGPWSSSDVGFEPGMLLFVGGHSDKGGGALYWDGEKPAPEEEVFERLKSGELQPGPTLRRMQAHEPDPYEQRIDALRLSPTVVESFISAWEAYVSLFCGRYDLNADQVSRAHRCLQHAQDAASQYLSRHRADFESLQAKRAAGKLPGEEGRQAVAKLRQPVDDIFDKRLKPCLEQIPTRQQRAAAPEVDALESQFANPWHKRTP